MEGFKKVICKNCIVYEKYDGGFREVITCTLKGNLVSYHVETQANFRFTDAEQIYKLGHVLDELKEYVHDEFNVRTDYSGYGLISKADTYANIRNWKLDNQTIKSLYRWLFRIDCPTFIRKNIFLTQNSIRMKPVPATKTNLLNLKEWKKRIRGVGRLRCTNK